MEPIPTQSEAADTFRYRAFISYSRIDRKVAAFLQRSLERFVLPRALQLARPIDPARKALSPVFRDEDELVPGQDLPLRIRDGLQQSEFLIVLCSPNAAQSKWVEREIIDFVMLGRRDQILAVVIAGEPDAEKKGGDLKAECLPLPLRRNINSDGVVTDQLTEPLWIDWRAHGRHDRLNFLRLVAALLGLTSLDELIRRDQLAEQSRRRFAQAITGVFILLGFTAASTALVAFTQLNVFRATESKFLSRQASEVNAPQGNFNAGNPIRALQIALEGAPTTQGAIVPRPLVTEIEAAVRVSMARVRLQRVLHHNGGVDNAWFSPDGKRVLTASRDATARIWNSDTGEPIGKLMKHASPVVAASYNHDGTRIVTIDEWFATGGATVRVWNGLTGSLIGTPIRHTMLVTRATFSPDGSRILVVSGDFHGKLGKQGIVAIWDAERSRLMGNPMRHMHAVVSAEFSPNGTLVLTTCLDGTARLWNARNGSAVGAVMNLGPVESYLGLPSASFSSDGTRVLTTNGYSVGKGFHAAKLWNGKTGAPIASLNHSAVVTGANFSPDGTQVLTIAKDNIARLWNSETGSFTGIALKHDTPIKAGVFTNDGKRILTETENIAQFWDATSGLPVGTAMSSDVGMGEPTISPDGTKLLILTLNRARLWDSTSGAPIYWSISHEDSIEQASFSPDGARLVTASRDGTARLWDLDVPTAPPPPMIHERNFSHVETARFVANDSRVLTISGFSGFDPDAPTKAALWDARSSARLVTPLDDAGHITEAKVSGDGKKLMTIVGNVASFWNTSTGSLLSRIAVNAQDRIAALSEDGTRILKTSTLNGAAVTATIWDTLTGLQVGVPIQFKDLSAATFSPNGSRIALVDDGHVRIWNVTNALLVSASMMNDEVTWGVTFSRDGALVGSWNRHHVRIFDAQTGTEIGAPLVHAGTVGGVEFSPDGKRVLTATGFEPGNQGEAQLWNLETSLRIGAPMKHDDMMRAARFSPDGNFVVTSSRDASAALWDAWTGTAVGPRMEHGNEVWDARFSLNGRLVVTASFDGTAKVWPAPTWLGSGSQLIARACKLTKEANIGPLPTHMRDQVFRSPRDGDPCDRKGLLDHRFYTEWLNAIFHQQ